MPEDTLQVVDDGGNSMSYWSAFSLPLISTSSEGTVFTIVSSGKRLIIRRGYSEVSAQSLFIEMLTPTAAESFLDCLTSKVKLRITPKTP